MTGYNWVVALHAAIAVLGIGQVGAIAILARTSDRALVPAIGRLAGTATWSLVLLLITGGIVTYFGPAFFVGMWWFRVSIALFLILGALNGQMRRAFRSADKTSLPRIEKLAWTMCVLVLAIVVLMEAKPW